MTRGTSLLLRGAVCMPFLYFDMVILSALFFPGYSHVTQYASEIGSAGTPSPRLFNGGIFLAAERPWRTPMTMRWRGRCRFRGIAAPGMRQ